ncbi:DUF4358 domain-containing protein [Clostridium sp. CS001]|uniref:DUF4358 domain-containing protein n=1 Tax=Clostridium sp. CS001 TaxID=2880648 RepID=UPI001CF3B214|nr:DUF4358 domain-containing protein [Clostridium sp. CS001]MCB2290806.1 DUF4358 domain-containing protein [Clostridium sp. CS001]
MKIKSIMVLALATILSLSVMVGCTQKGSENITPTGQLPKVHEAVKKAFGSSYTPSMPYEAPQLEEIFGVKIDLVKEFIAEGPMMNVHVDTFIGIEAQEGKAEQVEAALKAYKQKLIDSSVQYPMNLPKTKESAVQRMDNYVFFMILGEIPMDAETEEAQLAAAKAETKKATDAVESILKK